MLVAKSQITKKLKQAMNKKFIRTVGNYARDEHCFKKHPEKLESLKNKGYQRVTGESDWSPYKAPTTAKKAVKKIKKKLKKS